MAVFNVAGAPYAYAGYGTSVYGRYLLDYADATFTRASEAAAVDPRDLAVSLLAYRWGFYDLVTPWPGVNVPRIIPVDGAVLLEGSRQWILLRNREIDVDAAWSAFVQTVVTTGQTSPDGSTSADRLATPGASVGRFQNVAAANYIASMYTRRGSGSGAYVLYNYASAAVGVEVFGTAGVEWQRVQTPVGIGGATINLSETRGSGVFTFSARGNGAADAIYDLIGAEVGSFITSPVRTTTAAATRAADLLSFATLPEAIRQGSWQISLYMLHASSAINFIVAAQGIAATEEISYATASGRFSVRDGGADAVQSNVLTWSAGATLTLTFDATAGTIEVQGASAGNGKVTGVAWSWPNTTTFFGTRSNGTSPAFAVFSRPVRA